MEKPNFKKLCRMHIQQLTDFPFIEQDFDFITNYEFLCLVVEHLNKIIQNSNTQNDAITNLYDAFNTLKDYVDNYFENLDVQEEINNKLDEMAQDGTLANIFTIIVENNIMPYINNQNEQIAEIESVVSTQNQNISSISNKVNSVASGTPAGTYATVDALTTADPDHNKIYVVTADNKWYYYDTTNEEWSIGGNYLTTDISLVEVGPNDINMSSPLVDKNKSLFIEYSKIWGRDGNQTTNGNWACTKLFPVKAGDIVEIGTAIQDYLITWNLDKTYKGYKNIASSTNNVEYTVEDGVGFVSFNIYKDNFDTTITINDVDIYSLYKIEWLSCDENAIYPEKLYKLTDKIIDKNCYLTNGGFWNTSGEFTTNSNWNASKYKIPVKLNDKIEMVNGRGISIILFDEDDNVVQAYEHSYSNPLNYSYIITPLLDDAAYLKFNVFNNDLEDYDLKINGRSIFKNYNLEWLVVSEDNLSSELKLKISEYNQNKWFNKKSVMYGDSIVAGSPGTTPYAQRLQTELLLNQSANEGVSGRPIADGTPNGSGTVTTVANTISTYSTYDLVIIAGGTNDFKLNVPLGNILPVGSNNFNRNEFTGAYQHLLENIINTKDTIRIVMMTPLQRNNSGYDIYHTNTAGYKLIDYCNRIKEIAQLYSVPVIDMYSNSSLNLLNLSTYTLDGLHPNNTGYEILTDYIAHQLINM